MFRVTICALTLVLAGTGGTGRAGELDREAAPAKKVAVSPAATPAGGSEMDSESPQSACGWGWGRPYYGWGWGGFYPARVSYFNIGFGPGFYGYTPFGFYNSFYGGFGFSYRSYYSAFAPFGYYGYWW